MLIRRETLQTVRPATTADDTRHGLANLQIEPNGSVVATNGHILIKASELHPFDDADYPIVPGMPAETTAPTAPILIPADTADKLCKATPKRGSLEVLKTIYVRTNGDGSSYAAATDLQVPIVVKLTPDAGVTFPKYAAVIPAARPVVAILLGVPVLEVLLKSAKAAAAIAIRFELPTEAAYHKRELCAEVHGHAYEPTRKGECAECGDDRAAHTRSTGEVTSQIMATYHGPDVTATAVLMPMAL